MKMPDQSLRTASMSLKMVERDGDELTDITVNRRRSRSLSARSTQLGIANADSSHVARERISHPAFCCGTDCDSFIRHQRGEGRS